MRQLRLSAKREGKCMIKNLTGWRCAVPGFIVFLILSASFVYAPPIYISVSGKIQAGVDYVNYSASVDGAPQVILMNVENTGSAGCVVKVRADLYKDSVFLKTTWSEVEALEPGGTFLFHNCWMADVAGDIRANISVYQCYERFEWGQMSFNVVNSTVHESDNFFVSETKNSQDEINLTIMSNKTLENVLIIPYEYPLGWIVEPQRIERIDAGEVKTVTIKYHSSTWHARTIVFDIVTEDGREYDQVSVQLKEAEVKSEGIEWNDVIIVVLLVVVGVLAVELSRVKLRRKDKSRGKKGDGSSETLKIPLLY